MSAFSETIDTLRRAAPATPPTVDTAALDRGPVVQLSVRVPDALRTAVASTAAAQAVTVSAFVEAALRNAVADANDSFAGEAAELTGLLRAEIAAVIADGTYGAAAAEVDREEGWS